MFEYKDEVVEYIKSKTNRGFGHDVGIVPTVKGDIVFIEESTGELKKLLPPGLLVDIDVQVLEGLGFLKMVRESLVKKYVRKDFPQVDFYAGTYGKGFTVDFHNTESKNFAKRKYFVWVKENIPEDGYIILLNLKKQGVNEWKISKNVFHYFDDGKRYLEIIIGKDILQIYAVKNF